MPSEQDAVVTTRVKKGARPWSGFFLGLILGLALAVILQQAGVWPLDRLLVFGLPGLMALIGMLLSAVGRTRVRAFSSILPLILAVALLAFGATGFVGINEHGELNGGCTVEAQSDLDTTVVIDTSRQAPFEVDPNGGLSWVATSPGPIMNHFWNIYVDIGGFSVPVAGNHEAEPNTDGDVDNVGDVADVSGYVADISNYAGVELRGVFEVGGDIDGEGGACDGFGFVRLVTNPLATLISQIAAAIGLLALIALLFLAFSNTREAEVVPDESDDAAAGAAGTIGASGALTSDEDVGTSSGRHISPGPDDDSEPDGESPVTPADDNGAAGSDPGDEENQPPYF
ncbi:MAG: hypothetical protein WAN34_10600 [Acidimicrobiia bacterium]